MLLVFLCAGIPAWAAPEAFELQAPAAFAGREVANTGVNLGSFGYVRGQGSISGGSYASVANVEFDLDSEEAPDSYTFISNGWTATVDAATMVQSRLDHVVRLSFTLPAGQANPTLDLLVADDCWTHPLALVQVVNGLPVLTTISIGEMVGLTSSLSCHRATVPFVPTLPFRVLDGTAGQRGPAGCTMVADEWTDGPGVDYFRAITFYLDPSETGLHYTFHYSASGGAEVLRSLVAAQCSQAQQGRQTMGDFTTEDETGAVCITGFVPAGASYWITRDLDGACIESRMLDTSLIYPSPLQWSLRGQNALHPPMQTITLRVAVSNGASVSIHQDSAERSVTLADATVYTIEDYDAWGNPHHFQYRNYTASVNMRETWWLMQGSTQLNAEETWLYDGWSPLGGVPQDRQSVTFGIASGYGAHSSVTDTSGTGALTLALSGQRFDDYNQDGSPNHFYYDLWSATVDVSRPFFLNIGDASGALLTQLPAYELWFMNGWQPAGGTPIDNQSVTFVVPHGAQYLWVCQGSNTIDVVFKVRGHIEDYFNDEEGTPNFFEYDAYTATVDVNRPFYLAVDGIALADHQTDYFGTWVRQDGSKKLHFTLSLTLHGTRAAHDFTIQEPDGTLWNWSPSGTPETATLTLPNAWDADGSQPTWDLETEILITQWRHPYSGQSGLWRITDLTTGQSQRFNPGTAAAYTLNLGGWFAAATGFPITMSLSRWSHQIRIMDRSGGLYSVDPIASQGIYIFGTEGAWYESYYYFDATAHRPMLPGLEWRVYDATAQEFAPFDPAIPADYTNWHYTPKPTALAAVPQGGGVVKVTWALPHGGSELLAGSFTIWRTDQAVNHTAIATAFLQEDGSLPFHYTDTGVAIGSYTYTVSYTYGSQTGTDASIGVTIANPVPAPMNLAANQHADGSVVLTWQIPPTAGMDMLAGTFQIQGDGQGIANALSASACRVGTGTSPYSFSFTDSTPPTGSRTYRIAYSNAGATSNWASVGINVMDPTADSDEDGIPDMVELQYSGSVTGLDPEAIRYVNGETDGLNNLQAYQQGLMDRLKPPTTIATTTVVLNSSVHFDSHEEEVHTGEYDTTPPPGTEFAGSGQGTYSETDPETGEILKSYNDVLSGEDLQTYNDWKKMATTEPEGDGTWRVQWSSTVEQVLDSNDEPVEVDGEPLMHGTWSGKTRSKSEIVNTITVPDGASGSNDRIVSKPEPSPDVTELTDGKYHGSQSYTIEGQEGGTSGGPVITKAEFFQMRSAWAEIDVPSSEASRLAYAGAGGGLAASQSMDGSSEERAVFWIQTADGQPAVIPVQKTFVVTTTSSADPTNSVQELMTLAIPKYAVTSAPCPLAAAPGTTVIVQNLGPPSISGPTSGEYDGPDEASSASAPVADGNAPASLLEISLAGVVGDYIPSNKRDGEKHFVAVKATWLNLLGFRHLPYKYIVLRASGIDDESIFNTMYEWKVEPDEIGSVDKDATQLPIKIIAKECHIPRDATGHYVVTLHNKLTNQDVDKLHVWVVWATVETAGDPHNSFSIYNNQWAWYKLVSNIFFKMKIAPKTLFTADDSPDLKGVSDKNFSPLPDGEHELIDQNGVYDANGIPRGMPWKSGAINKWDMTRKMKNVVSKPDKFSVGSFADYWEHRRHYSHANPFNGTIVEWPDAEHTGIVGNDDCDPRPGKDDSEQTNPYTGYYGRYTALHHGVGEITSADLPKLSSPSSLAGAEGDQYEEWVLFKEFGRLQLGQKWYRISSNLNWHVVMKVIIGADGKWKNNGSDHYSENKSE